MEQGIPATYYSLLASRKKARGAGRLAWAARALKALCVLNAFGIPVYVALPNGRDYQHFDT